jgi:integrase
MVGFPEAPRKRVMLQESELKVFQQQVGDDANGTALKLLLHTGVRINELMQAKWDHVDFDAAIWTVPIANQKTGKRTRRDFVIPLTEEVMSLFAHLRVLAGASEWVLPVSGRKNPRSPHRTAGTLRVHLDKVVADTGLPEISPHDLRATVRSWLTKSALGVSLMTAERVLNHVQGGIVGTYDKDDAFEERREAMKKWSGFLEKVKTASDAGAPAMHPQKNKRPTEVSLSA